ncbi:MAG: hypothetical protein NWE93_07430 [Candidatus Bathyarchaeota archaeon]|nr:hypothetical protein [Candidatus Bathyarchaeota archaeon]
MKKSSRIRYFLIPIFLIAVLTVSALALQQTFSGAPQAKADPGVYVGVAFGGNTTEQAKLLIDKVKDYTNLFILASGRNPISENQTKVEEICNYAVDNGLSVIVNLGIKDYRNSSFADWFWDQASLDPIKQRWTEMWGDKFLGVYYNDEPGGIQLDGSWRRFFERQGDRLGESDSAALQSLEEIRQKLLAYVENGTRPNADDYELEANFFLEYIIMGDPGIGNLTYSDITSFTSDYGLYWWDYKGGYNVMLAELGWNVSLAEQIDLVKGAARLQDKEWGTMITWKYYQPPYLDSGDEIYAQMLSSYQAGAKYIAVFDYPYNDTANPYGVLTDDHFAAMQRFWSDVTTKSFPDMSQPVAALVLPKNFGWGLRNPDDNIWGFWTSDNRTEQTAVVTSQLLSYYGTQLDIIYQDPHFPISSVDYQHIYYWNSTVP